MGKNKAKRPVLPDHVVYKKTPVFGASPEHSDNISSPTWLFSLLELHGEYGWLKVTLAELPVVLSKLRDLERLTWTEIKSQSYGNKDRKSKHHEIPVDRLSGEAQERLRLLGQEDLDAVFSLRLQGECRVFGVKEQAKFKILWWDPLHEVCKSQKKNT